MSVMSDIVMLNNFESVEDTFGFDNSQLKDGILLLKIWLHQRQLPEVSFSCNVCSVSGFANHSVHSL